MYKKYKTFQVGHLIHFEPNDPEFNEWQTAIECAKRKSGIERPFGIWTGQNEIGNELLAIAYENNIFIKQV